MPAPPDTEGERTMTTTTGINPTTDLYPLRDCIRVAAAAHHAEDNARGRQAVEDDPANPNHTTGSAAWSIQVRREQIAEDTAYLAERLVRHSAGQTRGVAWTTRPAGAGAETRAALLRTLTTRLTDQAHDLFTGRGALPLLAGNLYAHTRTTTTPLTDLLHATGAGLSDGLRLLNRLVDLRVLLTSDDGWLRRPPDNRDRAARRLDVDGRLDARRARYAIDRQLWAWWQGEHARMGGSKSYRTARRHVQVTQLWRNPNEDYYPRHPRRADGRADYAAARAHLAVGALDTAGPLQQAA